MKMTMTAGPMAIAASVEGANAPTVRPSAALAKLSSVRMDWKRRKRAQLGLRPHSG